MEKVAAILTEIAKRVQDAWELNPDQVFFDPRPSELPPVGQDYAAIRYELIQGRRGTGGHDVMLLRVDVAAELQDPWVTQPTSEPPNPPPLPVPVDERRDTRMSCAGALHARLTPTAASEYDQVAGYEEPVVVEVLTSALEEVPGVSGSARILVGLTVEGWVTIPRGGL